MWSLILRNTNSLLRCRVLLIHAFRIPDVIENVQGVEVADNTFGDYTIQNKWKFAKKGKFRRD
jgi:hypothetical protein